jgi:catechol 2,3-dioxygenase-like lactoylglutathione lyase family enzyme
VGNGLLVHVRLRTQPECRFARCRIWLAQPQSCADFGRAPLAKPRLAALAMRRLSRYSVTQSALRRNAMDISVGVLDHYNLSTRKLGETIQFYEDVLGFKNGPRPPFTFPGAWLYSAGHPVLHINDISQTDKPQRPDSGVIDHVAFGSRGFEAMKKHLSGKGIPHRVNQVPNSTRWQIFLRDPNNVELELNFETKNELPA